MAPKTGDLQEETDTHLYWTDKLPAVNNSALVLFPSLPSLLLLPWCSLCNPGLQVCYASALPLGSTTSSTTAFKTTQHLTPREPTPSVDDALPWILLTCMQFDFTQPLSSLANLLQIFDSTMKPRSRLWPGFWTSISAPALDVPET